MTLTVAVTAEDIARGERAGLDRTPLALALARALGVDAAPVFQGPSLTPIFDVRVLALIEESTRWHIGWKGCDVALPRRAQLFAFVWKYGPCGGQPFAIRDEEGRVVALRPYAEIVTPFTFTLTLA